MNKHPYDSYIKDFKERGVDLDLISKVIFQKDQTPKDEAMKEDLKQYYEISKQEYFSRKQYFIQQNYLLFCMN
jgi:hypothetical protein